jgi:branched-chain amino acid transport system substrate-binding protein
VRTVGFIGFNDAYGEGWSQEFQRFADLRRIKVVGSERFNRTDTSVTGQILKLMAANPDAILIAGSGTPAALPQTTLVERGYRGKIYQTHGVANADFLRVGGKNVDGTLLPAGPILVAEQLPEHNPSRKTALEYKKLYESKHGPGSLSTFGGHAWDAVLLLEAAMPQALKAGRPGTPEFRAALRDALEGVKNLNATHGVFNMSAQDHNGLDQRARVMVRIDNGTWKLVQP